jgi:hypothetical protein
VIYLSQADFRGRNLFLEDFLEGLKTSLEDFALDRHSSLEEQSFQD